MRTAADWLLSQLTEFGEYVEMADTQATSGGLLQKIDARFKLLSLLALILGVAISRDLALILAAFALALGMAFVSKIRFRSLARWVWTPVILMTGLISVPALFTTPGQEIAGLSIGEVAVTRQGLLSAAMLFSRAEVTATLAALLALTTPWTTLLKALKVLQVPGIIVVIIGTTYRYLFLLIQTASEMSEARRSRTVGVLSPAHRRAIANATMGVLLTRSIQLSRDVDMAMRSRGFRGDVRVLDEFQSKPFDWIWLVISIGAAVLLGGAVG